MNNLSNVHPAIWRAWFTGCFWASKTQPIVDQSSIDTIDKGHPSVVEALQYMAWMGECVYTPQCQLSHNREPAVGKDAIGDGQIGPAMMAVAGVPRCAIPDFIPPPEAKFQYNDPDLQSIVEQMQRDGVQEAVGNGNWPRCHGVGNYHSKITMVDTSAMGGQVKAIWPQLVKRVIECDRRIGLRHRLIDTDRIEFTTGRRLDGVINSRWSFVPRSSGWIGLATVQNNQGCESTSQWCRFLASYNPRLLIEDMTTLLVHEDTHNKGFGHVNDRNSKMNPYIISGMSPFWEQNDSMLPKLNRAYGGVRVPNDNDDGGGDGDDEYSLSGTLELSLPDGKRRSFLIAGFDLGES